MRMLSMTNSLPSVPVGGMHQTAQEALAEAKASAERASKAESVNDYSSAVMYWEQGIKDVEYAATQIQNHPQPIHGTIQLREEIFCVQASCHYNAARVKLVLRRMPSEVTRHLQTASSAIDWAIYQSPNVGEYHIFKAGLLARMGNLNASEYELRRAVELNPADPNALPMLQELRRLQFLARLNQFELESITMQQSMWGMLDGSQQFINQITGVNQFPLMPQPGWPGYFYPAPYPPSVPNGSGAWWETATRMADTAGHFLDLVDKFMRVFGAS